MEEEQPLCFVDKYKQQLLELGFQEVGEDMYKGLPFGFGVDFFVELTGHCGFQRKHTCDGEILADYDYGYLRQVDDWDEFYELYKVLFNIKD